MHRSASSGWRVSTLRGWYIAHPRIVISSSDHQLEHVLGPAMLICLDELMILSDECYPSALRYLEPIRDVIVYALRLDTPDGTLSSYTRGKFRHFVGVLDGRQDSLKPEPFSVWREAHIRNHLSTSVFGRNDWDWWICGYVFWDFEGIRPLDLRIKCRRARNEQPQNHRLRDNWLDEEIKRSERQRTDIHEAGGRGYWAPGGNYFSRILGLSGEGKTLSC